MPMDDGGTSSSVRPDVPRYDDPPVGAGLRIVEVPLVVATPEDRKSVV